MWTMKKRTSFLAILTTVLLLLPLSLFSQLDGRARMKGTVTDTDGKPLAGVTVKLFSFRGNAGMEVKTDAKGQWKAMWVRGGKWNIDFEKKGYEPKKLSTTVKEQAKTTVIDISMKPVKGPVIKKDMVKDFEKANKLFEAGKIDDALALYKKLLADFPDAYNINLNVGNCYFQKQQYEKAVKAYLEVIKEEPGNTDALISIGNSYSNMKQNDKALEWYKKIDSAKIDDPVVLYNIGVFNFNAGNVKEALRFFKRSTEVKQDFTDGWYQLGMTYMGDNQNDAAVKAFETFLKYDSQSEKAAQVREIIKALKM
jgi:TolA-binding protein